MADVPVNAAPATLPDGSPWPRVSIVTPSFNQGSFIEETIVSVLEQGYPNVEHLVIDGGSEDGTAQVLERYRHRLTRVVSEPDRGQAHAINKGMSHATGDILTWLNSDDTLAPGALHGVAFAFHQSGADMVAGVCELTRDGELLESHLTSCGNGILPLPDLLDVDGRWTTGQFFYQPEVMFTRELWQRAGGYVDESLYYSMDYELWLRFARHRARLHVVGRPVARFRVHGGQKTRSRRKFVQELHRVRASFCPPPPPAAPAARRASPGPRRGRLRMVFLNDLGRIGGASIAHQRLAHSAVQAGHPVFSLAVADFVDPTRPLASNREIVDAVAQYQPELVVVGNLHGAGLAADVVGELRKRWPTVFLMHDLWMLTGRCAYPGPCRRYLAGCDARCPTAHEYPPLAPGRIHDAWRSRRVALTGGRRAVLLANSEWTAALARRAWPAGGDARVEVLRLGVPLDVFRPRDRVASRAALGLPQDRFILLFSSSSLEEVRKGGHLLRDALRLLRLPRILPVAVGHVPAGPLPIDGLRSLGYVSSDETLAQLYAAADLYVGPSLEEAFGQVFVEAAACGTPSVGFPVGGLPEALPHGVSGLLTRQVSAAALAETIATLYHDRALRDDLGRWGRLWVENERSSRSTFHSLLRGLDAADPALGLGLRRKIRFAPAPLPAPEVCTLAARFPRRRRLHARLWRSASWLLRNGWWLARHARTAEGWRRMRGYLGRVALGPARHRGR